MDNSENNIHTIELERVVQDGLEIYRFFCPQCGFKGEYYFYPTGRAQHVDIFAPGSPEAYHFNTELFLRLMADSLSQDGITLQTHDWGSWLPPKMSDLLGGD